MFSGFKLSFIVLILLLKLQVINCNVESMEPGQCISKFDYDYKVMQKLLVLETKITEQSVEIQNLKTVNQEKISLAFMAQLSSNIESPTQGQAVVFDSVITNVGEAYNPTTGTFAASVDGTYNFHLFASSPTKAAGTTLHLNIMRNLGQVGLIYLDNNNDRWIGRSTSVAVHLNRGDIVYVKITHTTGSVTLAGCSLCTHFSGFLIQED